MIDKEANTNVKDDDPLIMEPFSIESQESRTIESASNGQCSETIPTDMTAKKNRKKALLTQGNLLIVSIIVIALCCLAYAACAVATSGKTGNTSHVIDSIVLWGLQILGCTVVVPWIPMSMFSFMAFDAPGSERNPRVWLFVSALVGWPVLFVVASLLAQFLFYYSQQTGAALLVLGVVVWPPCAAMAFIFCRSPR